MKAKTIKLIKALKNFEEQEMRDDPDNWLERTLFPDIYKIVEQFENPVMEDNYDVYVDKILERLEDAYGEDYFGTSGEGSLMKYYTK